MAKARNKKIEEKHISVPINESPEEKEKRLNACRQEIAKILNEYNARLTVDSPTVSIISKD